MEGWTDVSFLATFLGIVVSGAVAIYIMRSQLRYDIAVRKKEEIESYWKVHAVLSGQLQRAIDGFQFYEDAEVKDEEMLQQSLTRVLDSLGGLDMDGVEYNGQRIHRSIIREVAFLIDLDNSPFMEVVDVDPGIYEDYKYMYLRQVMGRLTRIQRQLLRFHEEQHNRYKKLKKWTKRFE